MRLLVRSETLHYNLDAAVEAEARRSIEKLLSGRQKSSTSCLENDPDRLR